MPTKTAKKQHLNEKIIFGLVIAVAALILLLFLMTGYASQLRTQVTWNGTIIDTAQYPTSTGKPINDYVGNNIFLGKEEEATFTAVLNFFLDAYEMVTGKKI